MSERRRKHEAARCVFCNEPVSVDHVDCSNCGAALAPRDAAPVAERASPATIADVVSMLEQGRKSDAVRMYREQTGTGQQEAAAAVEAIERAAKTPSARICASRASRDANLKADLWALIQNDQKSEAIQLYCRRTGESIRRARNVVDALAREHVLAPGRAGCFTLIALCLAAPALLAFLAGR